MINDNNWNNADITAAEYEQMDLLQKTLYKQSRKAAENDTIFDVWNTVEEKTLMMSIIDDIYRTGNLINVDDYIKEFEKVETTIAQLNNNAQNMDDNEVVVETQEENGERKHTLTAASGFITGASNLYNLTVNGSRCACCGKQVKYMPPNGYCSVECAAKAIYNRIIKQMKGEYERETPGIIKSIKNIIGYIDLCLNIVDKIPELTTNLVKLPPEYKDYATAKISIMFLYLKRVICLLQIKKNDLMIKLLKSMKDGCMSDMALKIFPAIQFVINNIVAAREAMNTAVAVATNAINNAGPLYIGPQEYGFFMTLKSYMAICPFVKTNPNLYPPSQLGQFFWGPGNLTIPFDISKCQPGAISMGAASALQNVDMQKIEKIIHAVFRPINTVEYCMDPELFDLRLAFSDQNTAAIQTLQRLLEMLVVIGGDFLPSYKNLKLTNIWFIIAILMCWGPTTRSIYGDFIFHGPL